MLNSKMKNSSVTLPPSLAHYKIKKILPSTNNQIQLIVVQPPATSNSPSQILIKRIKVPPSSDMVMSYLYRCQMKALKTLKNTNIIKIYDIIHDNNRNGPLTYVIMEYMEKGTLKDNISRIRKSSSDVQILRLFKRILEGYQVIVDNLMLHRDIKTENIMLRTDWEPVIIDFGYAQDILSANKPTIKYNVGSPSYMAPQAYFNCLFSEKSDVWSLGVVFYQMITGKALDNQHKTEKQFFQALLRSGFEIPNNFDAPYKETIQQILRQSLQINVAKRSTCRKLKSIIDKALVQQLNSSLKMIKKSDKVTPSTNKYTVTFGSQNTPTSANETPSLQFSQSPKNIQNQLLQMPLSASTKSSKISSNHQQFTNNKIQYTTPQHILDILSSIKSQPVRSSYDNNKLKQKPLSNQVNRNSMPPLKNDDFGYLQNYDYKTEAQNVQAMSFSVQPSKLLWEQISPNNSKSHVDKLHISPTQYQYNFKYGNARCVTQNQVIPSYRSSLNASLYKNMNTVEEGSSIKGLAKSTKNGYVDSMPKTTKERNYQKKDKFVFPQQNQTGFRKIQIPRLVNNFPSQSKGFSDVKTLSSPTGQKMSNSSQAWFKKSVKFTYQ